MPTVETRTVGATGRQYSTLTLAEAAIGTIAGSSNLVTEDVQVVFELYNDSDFTERVTFDGTTTDDTRNVIVRAASGEETDGDLDTGVHFEPTSGSGHIITISDDHIHFEGIEFQQYSGSSTSDECFRVSSGVEGLSIEKCRLDTLNPSDTQGDGIYAGDYDVGSSSYPLTVRDCVITNFGRAGIHSQAYGSTTRDQRWKIVNCTIAGCNRGIGYRANQSGTRCHFELVNTIIIESGTEDYGETGTSSGSDETTGSTNNYTEDGTAPSDTTITATDNTSPGAGDWAIFGDLTSYADLRLVDDADNDALDGGVGTTNSSVTSEGIEGNARGVSTCDPGAYERSSGLSVSPSSLTTTVAFGAPGLDTQAEPASLAATVAFGAPSVSAAAIEVEPSSLSVPAAFGAPELSGQVEPASLAVSVAFGAPELGSEVEPSSLAVAVAFGAPTVGIASSVAPDSLVAAVAFGTPELHQEIEPASLSAPVAFGEPVVAVEMGILGTDAVGYRNNDQSSPLSFSHTLVGGHSRIVRIAINGSLATSGAALTVTYGGVAATEAVSANEGASATAYASLWYVLEADLPSDGSNTVSVSYTGAQVLQAYCSTLGTAAQSAPSTASDTATSTDTVTNTLSPVDDAWVMSAVGGRHSSFTYPDNWVHSASSGTERDGSPIASISGVVCASVAELEGASGETSFSSVFDSSIAKLARVTASFAPISTAAEPDSLAVPVTFGAPNLTFAQEVAPSSLAASVAFGTPVINTGVSPDSLEVAVSFGVPLLNTPVVPDSLSVPVAFGTPTPSTGAPQLFPDSLAVSVAFGSPSLQTDALELNPYGMLVLVEFGVPMVGTADSVGPASLSAPVVFGTPLVSTPGNTTAPTFPERATATQSVRLRLPRKMRDWKTENPAALKEQLHSLEKSLVDVISTQLPAQLNRVITSVAAHAPTHILGGVDPLDADKLKILMPFLGLTPNTSSEPTIASNVQHLSAILRAIWDAFKDHSARHEDGGDDEINVGGLSGQLADDQLTSWRKNTGASVGSFDSVNLIEGDNVSLSVTDGGGGEVDVTINADDLADHRTTHQNGGGDEINVGGLSGLLADPQTPTGHATSHQNGGSDEINVGGLSGLLADGQTPLAHATSHENGGSDEINVDGLSGQLADYQIVSIRKNTGTFLGGFKGFNLIEGSNVTLTVADGGSEEIDVTIAASGGGGSHAATHIQGGGDEIDGDQIDIDWNPSYYTPTTSPSEVTSVDHLTAHLAGIDNRLDEKASTTHASTHLRGGSDEIDADRLDIDWNPTNYTPSTSPTEVSSADHLTAHLAGIDNALPSVATHAATHIRAGSDEIDGDKLDIDFTPDNYTPSTSPSEVTHADELTAHLAGLDEKLLAPNDVISGVCAVTSLTTLSGTVTGAQIGDGVCACPTIDLADDYVIQWTRVSAANTVKIGVYNYSESTAPNLSFHVSILKVSQTGV